MAFTPPERFNIAEHFLDQRVSEGGGEREALRLDAGSWSYREVQAAADRAGRALLRLGVRPGERVLIALPDGPEFVAALFGTLKIGGVVVMVNPDLKPESLAALYDYTWATWALAGAGAAAAFAEARERAEWRPELMVAGDDGGVPGGLRRFEEETARESGDLPALGTHRDDPAIWLFSGGTTGRPKAVVQTHASFANTTELYAKAALGYREDDVTLSVPKLFFGYATGSNLLLPVLGRRGRGALPRAPDARGAVRADPPPPADDPDQRAEDGAPAWSRTRRPRRQDLSCLRFATSAGEALPAPLYQRWKETFGVELLDGLGTAEMWHVFVSNRPGAVRPGTLGRAVPGFELEVCDDDGPRGRRRRGRPPLGARRLAGPRLLAATPRRPPTPSAASGSSAATSSAATPRATSPTAAAATTCSRSAASGSPPRRSRAACCATRRWRSARWWGWRTQPD